MGVGITYALLQQIPIHEKLEKGIFFLKENLIVCLF